MPKLDRYLAGELARSVFAALVVLGMVSLGGVFADLLGEVARGRVPASLLLSQMGLRMVRYAPIILPLSLLLGILLAVGRMYRDSEMPVLAAVGVGPRRLLRPLLMVALPVVALIALASLWLGPWADRTANAMIADANRNVLAAGLEAGRFTTLSNGGVAYVGSMSADGTALRRIFVYRDQGERMDVATAATGQLSREDGHRVLALHDGFRVEGPTGAGLDYRLMRYASNDLLLPEPEDKRQTDDPAFRPTTALLGDGAPGAVAQLNWRLAPPLLALAFAIMALPLARTSPRQQRWGGMLIAVLAYLIGIFLMILGTQWLAEGRLPAAAGLWWLLLPLLGLAIWLYLRDGQLRLLRRRA